MMASERREAVLYLGRLLNNILDEALLIGQNKGRPNRMARLMEKARTIKEQLGIDFAEIGKEETRVNKILSSRKRENT